MTTETRIRSTTAEDVETIIYQRSAMFVAMGVDPALVQKWEAPFEVWLRERLDSGMYRGWFAVSGGEIVAGAGLWVQEWLPSPLTASPARGYIMNVYTEPAHRRQGLARRLVETALDYCRAAGIPTAALHASDEGRPIYEALGFTNTGEMRLRLE